MGLIGYIAETILATWIVFWVVAIFWFILSGQTGMALLFLVGLFIPLSMIAYEYWQNKKRVLILEDANNS
jgi:hypothetical protein